MDADDMADLREIVGLTGRYLEQLLEEGERHLFFEAPAGAEEGKVKKEEGPEPESRAAADELGSMRRTVSRCRKCGLAATRTKTVFGEGAPDAEVVLVGEAPGAREDASGRPFVGRAGELLTRMLASIGLAREKVYITNVLKCRPPNNRDPRPAEVESCEPYLLRQIDLIRPRLIVTFGRHAAQTLLKTDRGIGKLRGKFYDYHGVALIATFHPAYLLRNPADKRKAWEDLKKVRHFLTGEA